MNASTANRWARRVLLATALVSFYLFLEAVHFDAASILGTLALWASGQPLPAPVDWIGMLSSAFLFPMTYLLAPLLLGTVHGEWASALVAYPGLIVAVALFAIAADRNRRDRQQST